MTAASLPPDISPCRDCGRDVIRPGVLKKRPELKGAYLHCAGYGMCGTCRGRAARAGTLPDPAPKDQRRPTRPCGPKVGSPRAGDRLAVREPLAGERRRAALTVCHLAADAAQAAAVLEILGLLEPEVPIRPLAGALA